MATGAVTGLASEAAIARRFGMLAAAGAGTPSGTEAAVASLIRQGVPGLVSFGLAGGLAAKLEPGTLLLPPIVLGRGGDTVWVNMEWHGRLVVAARDAGLAPICVGGILGIDEVAATVAEKESLHRETGAIAVDLESHRTAVAAARARLPFVVLRAVADPAARPLPPAALVPLGKEGGLSPAILGSIARHPTQLPSLFRLGGDARRGFAALRHAGQILREDLAHP